MTIYPNKQEIFDDLKYCFKIKIPFDIKEKYNLSLREEQEIIAEWYGDYFNEMSSKNYSSGNTDY